MVRFVSKKGQSAHAYMTKSAVCFCVSSSMRLSREKTFAESSSVRSVCKIISVLIEFGTVLAHSMPRSKADFCANNFSSAYFVAEGEYRITNVFICYIYRI